MIARASEAEKRPGVWGRKVRWAAVGVEGGRRVVTASGLGWPEGGNLSEMLATTATYLPKKQLVLEVSKWLVCE